MQEQNRNTKCLNPCIQALPLQEPISVSSIKKIFFGPIPHKLISFQGKYRSPSSKLVDNGESEWEKSGLFEGDIVISNYRNAVERPGARWPLPVPVCISDEDFGNTMSIAL